MLDVNNGACRDGETMSYAEHPWKVSSTDVGSRTRLVE